MHARVHVEVARARAAAQPLDAAAGQEIGRARLDVHVDDAHRLWQLNAIFGSDELLLQRFDPRGDENPVPRNEYATINRAGEILHQYTMETDTPGAEGRLIAWTTGSYLSTEDQPNALLLANLDTGQITARYPLPAEPKYVEWGAWRTAGDGVALVRVAEPNVTGSPLDPIEYGVHASVAGDVTGWCAP